MKTTTNYKKVSALSLAFIVFLSLSFTQFLLVENVNAITTPWSLQVSVMNKDNQTVTNSNVAPFDLVQLKANVTYQNEPIANIFVAFKVVGPENSTTPTKVVRTAQTDTTGLAVISFRIPSGNASANPVRGVWKVNCTAASTNQTLQETALFQVGWPATITEIKLFDQNNTENNNFTNGQTVKAQVKVENNNAQQMNATLHMNITDVSGANINEIDIQNQELNESDTIINTQFSIPENASAGQATVNANLFSYSSIEQQVEVIAEPKNATFTIQEKQTQPTPTNEYRDVAITHANLSTDKVAAGQTVNISATTINKGNRTEQSTIRIKYNDDSAGSLAIQFSAEEEKNVSYLWNTTDVLPGTYTITVRIDPVTGENQTSDNEVQAGTLTVTQQPDVIPTVSATSLYVITLFIVGLTTFSLLSFLRWRRIPSPTIEVPMPLRSQERKENAKTSPNADGATQNIEKMTVQTGEVNYASVLPSKAEIKISRMDQDRLTDELTQFKLQSLELIPLSARGIDISIQKIQILRASKASIELIQNELSELEKIVDLQTKAMENEIAILKDAIQKLRILSKSNIEAPNQTVQALKDQTEPIQNDEAKKT